MIEESNERKTQILAAARSVVDEGGAKALTARAVMKEIGVSRPLLYHYFGNVDALIDAVVLDYVKEFEDALDRYEQGRDNDASSDAPASDAARFVSSIRPYISGEFCLAPNDISDISAAYVSYLNYCAQSLSKYIATSTNPLWQRPTCTDAVREMSVSSMLFGLATTLLINPDVDDERASQACVVPYFSTATEASSNISSSREQTSADDTFAPAQDKPRKGFLGRFFGA